MAYCSRALRPSQRRYCTTKREMLAVVAMCLQFRSYLRGAHFTLRTDHKSLVWLHRFKDTEGMLSRWLHFVAAISVLHYTQAGKGPWTGSWWWHTVAGHLGLRSDDTALLNARCWRWWPCAYSSDLICVEHILLSGRTTSH